MPKIFAVVGERRDDSDRLLLLGEDGQHYQYELMAGTTTPIVPDDAWIIDANPPLEDALGW